MTDATMAGLSPQPREWKQYGDVEPWSAGGGRREDGKYQIGQIVRNGERIWRAQRDTDVEPAAEALEDWTELDTYIEAPETDEKRLHIVELASDRGDIDVSRADLFEVSDSDDLPIYKTRSGAILASFNRSGQLEAVIGSRSLGFVAQDLAVRVNDIPESIIEQQPRASGAHRVGPALVRFHGFDEKGRPSHYIYRTDVSDPKLALQEIRGEILFVPNLGQSLAIAGGTNDTHARGEPTVINDKEVDRHRIIMMNTGVIGTHGVRGSASALRDFVPGKELPYDPVGGLAGGPSGGESGGIAYARMWNKLREEAGLSPQIVLPRHDGAGGRNIVKLGKGSHAYENALDSLRQVKAIAAIYGYEIYERDVTWNHGQSEGRNSRVGYLNQLIKFRREQQSDRDKIMGLEGRNQPLVLWCIQPSATTIGNASLAALAMIDAASDVITSRFFRVVGSFYHFRGDIGYTDEVHLLPLAYDYLYENVAKAIFTERVMGVPWTGIRPARELRLSGQSWNQRFHKQGGLPVTFDTTTVPEFPNFGFRILDGEGGEQLSISSGSVQIRDVDEKYFDVVGSLTVTPTAERPVLRYAREGRDKKVTHSRAWGNLRNTDPRLSVAVPGRRLDDWCCIFSSEAI